MEYVCMFVFVFVLEYIHYKWYVREIRMLESMLVYVRLIDC